jgi:hypothetical protein
MGVPICTCNKINENLVKELSIDNFKSNDQMNYINVVLTTNNNMNNSTNNNNNIVRKTNSNNENFDDKQINKDKYKKIVNENGVLTSQNAKPALSTSYSNNYVTNKTIIDEKYLQNVIKIQSYFKKYLVQKSKYEENKENEDENKESEGDENKESEKDKIKFKNIDKEDSLIFRMNLAVSETVFSSNSFHNSQISENTNNKNSKEDTFIVFPFNIKNKRKMNYKYSGYVYKKNKNKKSEKQSSLEEEKGSNDKKEKSGLIKEGFGKFIFNDGSEFCGIFHENILQQYGKYTNINKNGGNRNDKEIIITDNLNYEEYIGEYKDYVPNGFGIYKNYITNLKITGIFKNNTFSDIGIEESAEGGYTYYGDFINNKKEGYGTMIWKDGAKYQGEFKNNQANGYGIIEYPDNKYYQGEIKNGRMDGFGEFFWKDEKRYIGNYKNDKRNGFGIFIIRPNENQSTAVPSKRRNNINNYSAYIGFWKNGNKDGFGMTANFNEIKFGLWENGVKRRYLDNNFALKTYIKWIDKQYHKLFLSKHMEVLNLLEQCIMIDKKINPVKEENH